MTMVELLREKGMEWKRGELLILFVRTFYGRGIDRDEMALLIAAHA